jgi:signal transduction histidine kinase
MKGVSTAAPRPTTLRLVIATGSLAAGITLVLVLIPDAHFAYRAPSLHVALETTAALVSLLAAYLVLGRFWSSGRLDHVLVVGALGLIASTNLFFAAFPPALTGDRNGPFATWATASGHLLGAALFAAACLVPERRLARPQRAALITAGGVAVTLGLIALTTIALASHLPAGITAPPGHSARPDFVGPAALLAIELATMVAFVAAAIGLARRADATGDSLWRWFAVASTLAAAARLNYFLYPSEFSQFVYTGDIFRLCFCVVLLGGAAQEIRRYWAGQVDAAILDERRRIARDLHDGMAQELALIGRKARRLPDDGAPIAAAADRALEDARRAIAALSDVGNRPLAHTLAESAENVAARHGIRVELDVEPVDGVPRAAQEELIRIAGEAIVNAARHAKAGSVRVRLSNGDAVRLTISDDGVGFDPDAVRGRPGCFGLVHMGERARRLGARFRVSSAPGAGTDVEVVLP